VQDHQSFYLLHSTLPATSDNRSFRGHFVKAGFYAGFKLVFPHPTSEELSKVPASTVSTFLCQFLVGEFKSCANTQLHITPTPRKNLKNLCTSSACHQSSAAPLRKLHTHRNRIVEPELTLLSRLSSEIATLVTSSKISFHPQTKGPENSDEFEVDSSGYHKHLAGSFQLRKFKLKLRRQRAIKAKFLFSRDKIYRHSRHRTVRSSAGIRE
jgi:hypothetical protein